MATFGIIGATGFVGTRLAEIAVAAGHNVVKFSRTEKPGFRRSGPDLDLSGLDVIVNLAGESILGLWTKEKRRKILASRVEGTRDVVKALGRAGAPKVFLSASAVGFYGDTGEMAVDESSPCGTGFLAETCEAWEEEACAAEVLGVRTVRVRIGFVLGSGGAMRFVLPIFQAGLGGNLGNGRQWMSCVHVDDVAGLFLWAAENAEVSGAINAVQPMPVRNAEFTRTLARVVRRPAILPAPALAMKLALGDLSHVMLDSVRVLPRVAETGGYAFRYADLSSAFQSLVTPK